MPQPQQPQSPALAGQDRPANNSSDSIFSHTEERPHPLTPLVDGWIAVLLVVLWFGRDILESGFKNSVLQFGWGAIAITGGLVGVIIVVQFLRWWGTHFVIDEDEVRVEFRLISHNSQRIVYSKIQAVDINQPLVARAFGLAALRVDVGTDGARRIKYLKRDRAYRLRDYLLERAGRKTGVSAVTPAAGTPRPTSRFAGVLEDVSTADQVIFRVPPKRLILSTLMGNYVLGFFIYGLIPLVISFFLPEIGKVLGISLVPLLIGLGMNIFNEVRKGFNFTLTSSGGGVKATAGMTELVSQSVPIHRIQGVVVEQPMIWRLLGWYRVRIDVLGTRVGEHSEVNNTVLPVGHIDDVHAALATVLPDINLDDVEMRPLPKRARWLRWFDAQTFTWGYSDDVIVAKGHLLTREQVIVPHARVQSVEISQGPLQRWLRLAGVSAHTTPGPVSLFCRLLDQDDARALAMGEMTRMRQARQQLLA